MPENSSIATLREAYRELVRKYHPDMNEGHPVKRFLEIQEAWECLRNDSAREEHRQALQHSGGSEPPLPHDSEAGYTGFAQRSDDEIDVDLKEFELERAFAIRGGRFTTRIPVESVCPMCDGQTLQRHNCEMCRKTGALSMKVRAEIEVPSGVQDGSIYTLSAQLELFGHRSLRARIYLV